MRVAETFPVLGLAALLALSLPAQVPKPTEYQVKAAYLSNFGKFVDWSAKPGAIRDEPFNVCILGEDPFGPVLDAALAGEMVDHAPLVARRIPKAGEAVNCRVLFIGSSEDDHLKDILSAVAGAGVLTVG